MVIVLTQNKEVSYTLVHISKGFLCNLDNVEISNYSSSSQSILKGQVGPNPYF